MDFLKKRSIEKVIYTDISGAYPCTKLGLINQIG